MYKIIELLKQSESPHLFLLNVGLSQEEYYGPPNARIFGTNEFHKWWTNLDILAEKIVKSANEDEILKIITKLACLEFSLIPTYPLGTPYLQSQRDPSKGEKRLAEQLIIAYIAKHENKNLFSERDTSSYNFNDTLANHKISPKIKSMWFMVNKAAQETLNAADYIAFKKRNVVLNWYIMIRIHRIFSARSLPPNVATAFNSNLIQDVVEPTPMHIPEPDIAAKLSAIKDHIMNTNWKIGNYLLFKGGVVNEGKRLPHRINDILNLIKKTESKESDDKEIYAEIIEKAKEALDKPKVGRHSQTTSFYKDIFNHNVLREDYKFNRADVPEPKASNG